MIHYERYEKRGDKPGHPFRGNGSTGGSGSRVLVAGRTYSCLTKSGSRHERYVTVVSQDGDNVTVTAVKKGTLGANSNAVVSSTPYVIPLSRIGAVVKDVDV